MLQNTVDQWKGMTPVHLDPVANGFPKFDQEHSYLKKYVLPQDQSSVFRAPDLGPETKHWLQPDANFRAADSQIKTDADIAHSIQLRLSRWFGILDSKVQAIQSAAGGAGTTVSIDALDLREDLGEAQEMLAYLVRHMNARRLKLVVGRLPKGPKFQKPDSAYVTENNILGGSALEASAKAALAQRGFV